MSTPLGIRPTVDFAFKLLLGSPDHPAITVHFLNSVLGGDPQITSVTILNPIQGREADDDKLSVLDLVATDERGRLFNIEMQTSVPAGLAQRLIYYTSCLYVGQLTQGTEYEELRPTITICVLEQNLFPKAPRFHLDFRLRDPEGLLLHDDLQIHLLELPKSRATEHNIHEVSDLERWAFFLRHAEFFTPETIQRLLPRSPFEEAFGVLHMIQDTAIKRILYEFSLKKERDEIWRLNSARREGEKLGREEGLAKGLEEGRSLGMLAGQIQALEKLLKLPMTPDTNLDLLSIEQLQARLAELEQQISERLK